MKVENLINQENIKEKAFNIYKDFLDTLPDKLKKCSIIKFSVEDGIAFIEISIPEDMSHEWLYQNFVTPDEIKTEIGNFKVRKICYSSIFVEKEKTKEDLSAEEILNGLLP